MDENRHRRIDIAIKTTTALVAIFGAAIGLWKYFDSVEKEFRKPYWEKQVALYFQATSSAATLATIDNPEERQEAEAKFWELYWGPLALVEDRKVEGAMVRFGNCLKGGNCEGSNLRQLSLELAHTCRESLGTTWDLKLEELKGAGK